MKTCKTGTLALTGLGGAAAGALIYKAYKESQEAAVSGLGVVLRAPIAPISSTRFPGLPNQVSPIPKPTYHWDDAGTWYYVLNKLQEGRLINLATLDKATELKLKTLTEDLIRQAIREGRFYDPSLSMSEHLAMIRGYYVGGRTSYLYVRTTEPNHEMGILLYRPCPTCKRYPITYPKLKQLLTSAKAPGAALY